jgi:RNA polymerase sigma factor (sigma-70 family)
MIRPAVMDERAGGAADVEAEGAWPSEAAFRDFYSRTAPSLWRYLRHTLGSAADADDVLQEAYVRVLRAPGAPRDVGEMRGYLYRVAANLAVDHFRRTKRRREDPAMGTEAVDESGNVEDRAARRIDMERTFAQLKPQERMLLWLAYVERASHREIADAVQVGEQSVKVLLSRARQRLAALVRETSRARS